VRGGRAVVFRFLHQFFIDRPGMLELVAQQGFPVHAISAAVDGIPSLHVCLNYLPARLQPSEPLDLASQVFAVQLVTHLMRRYPIPPSLQAGRVALSYMARMNPRLPERAHLLERCLPCLPIMCAVFPELIVVATDILLRIQGQCVSSFERRMADVADGRSRLLPVDTNSGSHSGDGGGDGEHTPIVCVRSEAASTVGAWDSSHPTAAALDRLRKLTLLTFTEIRADAVHLLAK
jgi:Integrator complex subunit 2